MCVQKTWARRWLAQRLEAGRNSSSDLLHKHLQSYTIKMFLSWATLETTSLGKHISHVLVLKNWWPLSCSSNFLFTPAVCCLKAWRSWFWTQLRCFFLHGVCMFSQFFHAFPPDASGASSHIKRHACKLLNSAVTTNYQTVKMGQIQENIALHS